MTYADAIRLSSEAKQLKNLMSRVTAKSAELLTIALATNASSETYLQMPTTIGNKYYWLQFHNDSAKAWIEGGFGSVPKGGAEIRIYLPKEASAQGYYISGYGAACLKCYLEAGAPQIQLTNAV
jgi:hypothetical protein